MVVAGQKSDAVRARWKSAGLRRPADPARRDDFADRAEAPVDDDGEPFAQSDPKERGEGRARAIGRQIARLIRGGRRLLGLTIFSSLTRRIVFLNLAALAVLVVGILYLNQWRAGLIDARVQSLRVQGEIISAAVAASAKVDSNVITVNPDRLLELQTGDAVSPLNFVDPALEFPINPEQVAPLLRNLVTPTRTRARIYDRDGLMILDSQNIYVQGEVLGNRTDAEAPGFFLWAWWNAAVTWVPGAQFSLYQEYGANEGKRYPEVEAAIGGAPADIVRVDAQGRMVVSVAVPIKRVRSVAGALLLSTRPGDIDAIVATERMAILRIALVAAAVTTVLSLLLAGTIAGPVRRLAAAAERVPSSFRERVEIDDFTDRSDEIGHLSGALRAMTNALFNRIDAIERFAADVAHELKNPLTSLRSAVETLPRTQKPEDRERLLLIIQHDVRRLDRLISDISNASRLDAELARETAGPVDLIKLVEAMVSMHADIAQTRGIEIVFEQRPQRGKIDVFGHDSRLAQVFSNLIDNAVSFSHEGGKVKVLMVLGPQDCTVTISDEGPGIRGDISRIFERFYTDRPEAESFGDHSGLGLSISRQIIEAHRGTIKASNRDDRSGAVFTVILPRARK